MTDKRRAVETLLRDEEWSKKTDNWIATTCGVSQPFAAKVRVEVGALQTVRSAADGRVMNTANIGHRGRI